MKTCTLFPDWKPVLKSVGGKLSPICIKRVDAHQIIHAEKDTQAMTDVERTHELREASVD
jgi:hypothetical protein